MMRVSDSIARVAGDERDRSDLKFRTNWSEFRVVGLRELLIWMSEVGTILAAHCTGAQK